MGGKLELRAISKDFHGFAIKHLSLTVEPGEYLVVVGPTGAGKTLLLETIQGFHPLDEGEILLDGTDITRLPHHQRRISYVPQNPAFPPGTTVRQALTLGLGQPLLSQERNLEGVINLMGLASLLDREAHTLSGGEKRRLTLARALIRNPRVLLLDEPLNNLDVISKEALRRELQAIHSYLGLTTIHVTHDQVDALSLATRLAVIRGGELRKTGTIAQVYRDPQDEYAARFLGYQNIYPIEEAAPQGPNTRLSLGPITVVTTHPVSPSHGKAAVHGSEVSLHAKTPWAPNHNLFKGVVTRLTTLGPRTIVTVDIGVEMTLELPTLRTPYIPREGEETWVSFPYGAVKPVKP